jgi:hypothetical protein
MRLLAQAKEVAKKRNIRNWETLNISKAKNKRFSIIIPSGKLINFGLWEYKGKGTFLDHGDETIRKAWIARHSKILKGDKKAYMDKESPEYYSYNILW